MNDQHKTHSYKKLPIVFVLLGVSCYCVAIEVLLVTLQQSILSLVFGLAIFPLLLWSFRSFFSIHSAKPRIIGTARNKNLKPFLISIALIYLFIGLSFLLEAHLRVPLLIGFWVIFGTVLAMLGSSRRFINYCANMSILNDLDAQKIDSLSVDELNKMIELALRLGQTKTADSLSLLILKKIDIDT